MTLKTFSHSILTVCFLIFTCNAFAQQYMYEEINSTLNAEKPPAYIALVNKFKPLQQRAIPIDSTEGGQGYTVEVNFPFWFMLRSKRKTGRLKQDTTLIPIVTYSRLYLDYGFHTRVVKSVESSPILPPTNRFGIKGEKIFNIRSDGEKSTGFRAWSFKRGDLSDHVFDKDKKHSFMAASAYWHHYSNGQGEGVFKQDSTGASLNRNDYLKGDFSTNFIRFSYSYHWFKSNKFHLGGMVGWQREIGTDKGFLSFRGEQENRYGKSRVLVTGLFSYGFKNPWSFKLFKNQNIPIIPFEQINFRFDAEYITDHKTLTDYPYNNRYPFGIHLYVELPIAAFPPAGLICHWYRGRDYLNVRYDDPVSAFQFGISLELFRHTLRYGDN